MTSGQQQSLIASSQFWLDLTSVPMYYNEGDYREGTNNLLHIPREMPDSSTVFIAPSATAVIVWGVTGSFGIFFNPGWGESRLDGGLYASTGTGYGFDPSLAFKFGVVQGDASNFLGESRNMNIGPSLLQKGGVTVIMDNTGNVKGGSANYGAVGLPFGTFSVTNEHAWRWRRTDTGDPGD